MIERPYHNISTIGVISDTHIPVRARSLPDSIANEFSGVDLILHAGDLVEESVIGELEQLAPVVAVRGNMDLFSGDMPKQALLNINGRFRIRLMHGDVPPGGAVHAAKRAFSGVDCVVFGHSHKAMNEIIDGILLFNPGSANDPRSGSKATIGRLHIGENIKGEIIEL